MSAGRTIAHEPGTRLPGARPTALAGPARPPLGSTTASTTTTATATV